LLTIPQGGVKNNQMVFHEISINGWQSAITIAEEKRGLVFYTKKNLLIARQGRSLSNRRKQAFSFTLAKLITKRQLLLCRVF
jgi:hypothetical protein